VGYWDLSEGSGVTAADRSANHNNGTLGGERLAFEPAWTSSGAPSLGGALQFDGTNDFVQLPATGFADFSGGLTIELWAFPTAVGSWQRFVDFGDGSPSDNILFSRVGTSNDLALQLFN